MKLKRGFTVVEVIVVIGIIAVLTVIIFPAINNIRAKNRDAERIADIAALQLGLSLYKNKSDGAYPSYLDSLVPSFVPADSTVDPSGQLYTYVPLTKSTKCTYYHLGAVLELPSGQIDTADTFTSDVGNISNGYSYCSGYSGPGLATGTKNYNVHP